MNPMVAEPSRITRRSLLHTLNGMADQQRGRRSIEVGPTGRRVADNLARLRKVRGITTRQLSGLLEKNGRAIPASGITRMEKGERVVTSDELTALAAALRVNVSALMLPLVDDPAETVELSGVGSVSAEQAWDWFDGEMPIEQVVPGDPSGALMQFQLYARPAGRRVQLAAGDGD